MSEEIKSTDSETILGDITILNLEPEKSCIFTDLVEKYPDIAGLARGKELIRSMGLCKAVYEGAQYAMNTDEFEEEREEGLEAVMKDMANGVVGIMASLKAFFDKQIEVINKDKEEAPEGKDK